jgi:multiple sugar transport system substrate-binding protein
MLYNGTWTAVDLRKKFADDVVFMPPPDLGTGPKIGGASWQWGMSADCPAQEGALEFLRFSATDEYRVLYAKELSLIPVTETAAAEVENYAPGGKYRVFYDLADRFAELRPVTPAYPFISSTFQKAYADILSGGDPETVLDKAVADIDNNIQQNGGYEF